MSIQGMQSSLRNNRRDRKSIFDKKDNTLNPDFGKFEDHKKMTTYEFHELQKKIKKDNAERQKKFIIKSVLSISLLVAVVIYLLFFF